MLEIKGLVACLSGDDCEDGKEILKGLDLVIPKGEVHAIMGPNGSGKSTLSYVLAGHPGYSVTGGSISLNGEDVIEMGADERACKGIFLAFQYPVEIPGISNINFLRTALNSQRKYNNLDPISSSDFLQKISEAAKKLNISSDMLRRYVNFGFSGGEKKRNEILQMAVLDPKLAVLDETDSGLDVDAMRLVADGINSMRSPDRSFCLITHYWRLLDYVVPDVVHILYDGKIIKSGNSSLAMEIENEGYEKIIGADKKVS